MFADNPNFRGSDQSIFTTIQSSETDRLTGFGYKTTKTGFTLGSKFEYYEKNLANKNSKKSKKYPISA